MPDLKKMLTLEALSEALPSWLKRSTKPEYNADEIDSTLTTNQFVTASDKDNWNAKGTYSKPSGGIPKSDLSSIVQTSLEKADSALQSETDPTVPTWAKQTNKPSYTQDEVPDGSTYKRVTQTEKDAWSGKQNALTTTQMQAVNSGITSEGVAQISANQANILYSLNTGVKNELDNFGTTSYESSGVTFTFNEDGSVRIKGTATGGNAAFYYYTGRYSYISNIYKGHILSGVTGGAEGTYGLLAQYSSNGTSWATQEMCKTAPITIKSDYNYINICIIVFSGQTVDTTIYPMLCTPEAWAQSTDYQPPAKPNSTLTRLEAEDREALAEVVDSGAKNKVDIANVTTTESSYVFNNVAISLSAGSYVFSYTSNQSISGNVELILRNGTTVLADHVVTSTSGRIEIPFTITSAANNITLYSVRAGTYSDFMICTLADWKASQKYAPYRPNLDLVYSSLKSEAKYNTASVSDTYSLIGKVTTTSHRLCRITVTQEYAQKPPTGLILSKSNNASDFDNILQLVGQEVTASERVASLTISEMCRFTLDRPVYIWAKADGSGTNNFIVLCEHFGDIGGVNSNLNA